MPSKKISKKKLVATKKSSNRKKPTASPKKKITKTSKTKKNNSNKNTKSNSPLKKSPATKKIAKKNPKPKVEPVPPPFHLYQNSTQKKEKEPQQLTYADGFASVVNLLRGRKNVLVLAGAGMSVSCGIPDFRSKDSGLYNTLDAEELGLSCPEDLFDYEVFQEDPRPFFQFAKHIYFPLGKDKDMEPSCSHRFLALLQKKGMLLRVYTQNMDGLETVAGVSPNKMVHAHGSLQWATCCKCKRKVQSSALKPDILKGSVPLCQHPAASTSATAKTKSPSKNKKTPIMPPRLTRASSTSSVSSSATSSSLLCNNNTAKINTRKRLRRRPLPEAMEEDNDNNGCDSSSSSKICGGILKPGVTFFGEALHDNVRRRLEADREKADALIVIGTSLSVAPMSKVIEYLPPTIPRILINRTLVHPPRTTGTATTSSSSEDDEDDEEEEQDFREDYVFDAHLLGFCDDVTRALVKELHDDKTRGASGMDQEAVEKEATTPEIDDDDDDNDDDNGGKLLAALKDDDAFYSLDEWTATNIPSERVFLFPGAILSDEQALDLEYREVANCDGCAQEIRGKIRKCVQCFDYDLCSRCYPKHSKIHFQGKHTFTIEPSGR
mmetsp:Transcript_12997/g.20215  ORF Transcript_12997/g.20215 Transcript_12997/m.20215 type:complete len:607 (+) Transcript_12997:253-2073(+)